MERFMTNHEVEWMDFQVTESRGFKYFCFADVQQACVLANDFWRETGSNDMVLLRDATTFDTGTVNTTNRIRHFTGMTKCVPEPDARRPADMSGEFLTRLCADWFCVGDVLQVRYDTNLFFTRKRNLEASSFLK
jgi:hypothetical protein